MNERQHYAITHPLTDPDTDSTQPLTRIDTQRDGNILLSILAVDR